MPINKVDFLPKYNIIPKISIKKVIINRDFILPKLGLSMHKWTIIIAGISAIM